MRTKTWLAATVAAAVVGAAPAVAQADTLGSVTPPGDVQATLPCPQNPSAVLAQDASDPIPFTVPGTGQITQWETNQTGNSAPGGEQLDLLVVRNSGSGYDVVGSDLENLPATLPANGIVTFQIANPINVRAGDLLALWSPVSNSTPLCAFGSPSLMADTFVIFGPLSGVPGPGQPLPVLTPTADPGFLLDLAATFVPNTDDAGVTTTAGPANAVAGEPALLSSIVANGNVDNAPITFTDVVPAGLTIDSAVAGAGLCSIAGQTVTCTIGGLAAGQSAPVQIVVTPTTAGTYKNAVSVALPASDTDPNLANNAASAPLSVAPAAVTASALSASPAPRCVVPSLNRIPASFARRVLGLLGCRVGKLRQVHSNTVARGEVIRSTPGAGRYAAAKVVALQVSSGPAKHHR